MALEFLGIDPATNGGDCPSVWFDGDTGDYILKGWKVDDVTLDQTYPDHRENVIRFPARMVQFLTRE